MLVTPLSSSNFVLDYTMWNHSTAKSIINKAIDKQSRKRQRKTTKVHSNLKEQKFVFSLSVITS